MPHQRRCRLHPTFVRHPTVVPKSSVVLVTPSRAITSCVLLLGPALLSAQPAYFSNTDAGRPLRTEDAPALPRYALDLHLAPVWRTSSDASVWGASAGAYYGLVPRTQVEIEIPVIVQSVAGSTQTDLLGVRLAAQHNLNVERRAWPAIAVEGGVRIAAGEVRRTHTSIKGIATKTFRWARLHVNSEAVFGDEPADSRARASLNRWQTGIAADRAFVRDALLLGADVVAAQPLDASLRVQWSAAAGARYQLSQRVAVDVRLARTFTGSSREWGVGAAVTRFFALPGLLPGFGRW